jgi:ABC transport system ATP-binding/permease protein
MWEPNPKVRGRTEAIKHDGDACRTRPARSGPRSRRSAAALPLARHGSFFVPFRMPLFTATRLAKSFGSRSLFAEASLSLEEGEKVGLIGANGAGKSTLLRILAGLESADVGGVAMQRGATIGYLAQEPELPPGLTIREAVAAGRPGLLEALRAYEDIARQLESGTRATDDLLAAQGELMARIDALGGWGWQHEVETLLTRLQVTEWNRRVDGLSGGERKRVALASVLLERPDLLLLDEPTNHLDADTTLWLEDHLLAYHGTVLLVTHDRYFLDRVVTRMIEVEGGRFGSFEGGYTEYLETKAERDTRRSVEASKRARLLEQELAWVKRSPAARTGKQKARIKRLHEVLATAESSDRAARELAIDFAPPPRLGRTVLDLEDVSIAFGGLSLIHDFTTRVRAGERIGIIGPNGAGKTTLLRLILGEVVPDYGALRFGANTRPAYFDQARMDLDPSLSVYESVANEEWVEYGGRRVHVRSYLESFLFPTRTHEQRVGTLSGGERNRLLLAKLLLRDANLLLLDEPTNDLDLETLQVLESALVEFGGTVLVVTHDRFFLDKVATGLLVFEEGGVVHRHEGGYDLYRRLREERESSTRATARPATPAATPIRPAAAKARRLTWTERGELAGMESAIIEAEALRDRLGEELADPTLYADTPERVAPLRAEFETAERRVEELYARWARLEEIADSD